VFVGTGSASIWSVPELRVRRDDLASCELVEGESLRKDLYEGETQLLVERFALTANNVTYAALGERLGYWRLFPAPAGWGRIPAWGYTRVVGSRSPALAEGQRMFGLVPMGSYLTVCPAPHPVGFMDAAPHRAELSPVYNQYVSLEDAGDDAALLMRPLFGTSVLLDLVLSERGLGDARTVVLTSASSKTAYGLAHLLRGRHVETIGLTSGTRRAWVEGLGLYDAVMAYDEVGDLGARGDAVLTSRATARSCDACTSSSATRSSARFSLASRTGSSEPTRRRCRARFPSSSSPPTKWSGAGASWRGGTQSHGRSSRQCWSARCASSGSLTATS
jgi:Protein of unknown function (DUF2855)